MPLLDHFHEPLLSEDSWESFHSFWAVGIGENLNRLLPPRYRALVQTHLGSQVEADVAEFERATDSAEEKVNGPAGGVALHTYAPPVAAMTMPAVYPDEMEVQVIDRRGSMRLVAVVELVSPRNKDRPEARGAFAAKCAAYLERGVGVVVADTVTSHHFHLHNELVRVLQLASTFVLPEAEYLSAIAYRPVRRSDKNEIDVWPAPLVVGEPLPTLPLALRGARAVPLDLEGTYTQARERSRL
jgi:hypothetical protein